jgi:hypothetical protein
MLTKVTIILVINRTIVTGAQIFLSILLGVMIFKITESAENPTTKYTATSANDLNCVNNSPAFVRTITAIKLKTRLLIRLTILIFGGYFPGYFPPIDASPHGIPAVKQSWNRTTTAVRIAKIIAEIVTIILISALP